MQKRKFWIIFIMLFLLSGLMAFYVFAHPGGLDANGGHYNRKTGEYHLHRASKQTTTKPEKIESSTQEKPSVLSPGAESYIPTRIEWFAVEVQGIVNGLGRIMVIPDLKQTETINLIIAKNQISVETIEAIKSLILLRAKLKGWDWIKINVLYSETE